MIDFKICNACKQEKPASEFYHRIGMKHHLSSECIECMKIRGKLAAKTPHWLSSIETENSTLAKLAAIGIPALPGKALNHNFCDILCYGCIGIEVKTSMLHKTGYVFKFSQPQVRDNMIRGDFVLLTPYIDGQLQYYLFPKDHPTFWRDGKLKTAAAYYPAASHRKKVKGTVTLTETDMNLANEAWYLVEDKLAAIKKQLLETGAYIPEWIKREIKYNHENNGRRTQ